MSKQITIRVPDEQVEFLDEQVAAGARSRAAVVSDALRRLQREQIDAEIAAAYTREPAHLPDEWGMPLDAEQATANVIREERW